MVLSELQTKQIEREAKIIVSAMRKEGIVIDKDRYTEILNDLMEISMKEVQKGKSPITWLFQTNE